MFAAPGADWENNLAVSVPPRPRIAAVDALIGFASATQVGTNDATRFQASIMQLTASTMQPANLPASVLAAVGVDRPPSQQFHRQGLHRSTACDLAKSGLLAVAPISSPVVRVGSNFERAAVILDGDHGASRPPADDQVADRQGMVAARGIVDDLRWVDAPINW